MRALITGATGFVGRALTRHLVQQDHTVTALVRPRQRAGSDPVAELRDLGVQIVSGTVFEPGPLATALDGQDAVVHAAWQAARPTIPGAPQAGDADDQWRENVDGSRLLIDAAVRANLRRMVFLSTVAVYPGDTPSPVREDGRTYLPEEVQGRTGRAYQATKLAVEEMIRHLLPPSAYVILRPSMVYGPGAQFAPELLKNILRGTQRRSPQPVNWVHVDDMVRAALLAAETTDAAGMTLNIAGRETVPGEQLCDAMLQLAQAEIQGFPPARPRLEMLTPRYDTARARQYLHFTPQIDLAAGLPGLVGAALDELTPEDVMPAQPVGPQPGWRAGIRPVGPMGPPRFAARRGALQRGPFWRPR